MSIQDPQKQPPEAGQQASQNQEVYDDSPQAYTKRRDEALASVSNAAAST